MHAARLQLPPQHRDPLQGHWACARGGGVVVAVARTARASEPEFRSLACGWMSVFCTLLGPQKLLSFISGVRTRAARGSARDTWKQGSKSLVSATGFRIRSCYCTAGHLKTITVPGYPLSADGKKEKRCFLPVPALPI